MKLSASRFAPDAAGTLRTAHCGTVILSLSDAAVQDWFGLYRCALTVQSTRFVTVEPPLFDVRITLAENETVTADSERWSSTHPGHDPSETFDSVHTSPAIPSGRSTGSFPKRQTP